MEKLQELLTTLPVPSTTTILMSTVGSTVHPLYSWWVRQKREKELILLRPKRLVVIAGCDSGLGLSMAVWASQLGYNVVAGCINVEGEGAKLIKSSGDKAKVVELDVRNEQSIRAFREECEKFMVETNTELWAIISNPVVAVCGEFLWQTKPQLEWQMDVNFWGSVNLTKEFQSLLLDNKARLILISSDCSKLALPGLALYAASKTALESWGGALRLEVGKYGVTVVSYQPGSFGLTSELFSNQTQHLEEMEKVMSEGDKSFYGQHFQDWKKLKGQVPSKLAPTHVHSNKRQEKDLKLLLEGELGRKPIVKYESTAQFALRWGEKILPRALSDKLLTTLMNGRATSWKKVAYGFKK